MTKRLTRLPSINCPHCGARSTVRDSVQVTDLVRELRLVCQNEDCDHTFVGQLSIIKTIRPATQPRADVRLPFGTWRARPVNAEPKPANENHPEPANDDQDERIGLLGAALTAAMPT